MIWIRRRYKGETWATTPIMSTFEQHFMELGGPPSMLMIEEDHGPSDSTIWIRVPDKAIVGPYAGFEEASPSLLPKKAILLIGHNAEFEKVFTYGSSRP